MSPRSRQPASLAARRTGALNLGAGPMPAPTLEPRSYFDGSMALMVRLSPCVPVVVGAGAAAVAGGSAASLELVLSPAEAPPQPATSSAAASSADPRRAHTPVTVEVRNATGSR